jgi:hypothetical protein
MFAGFTISLYLNKSSALRCLSNKLTSVTLALGRARQNDEFLPTFPNLLLGAWGPDQTSIKQGNELALSTVNQLVQYLNCQSRIAKHVE